MRAGASWRQRVFLGALPSTADDARVASVSRRQIDVSVGVIRVDFDISATCPVRLGGLNRSPQHFILEGKDGVWDGTEIS